ncbi:hypothetical protein CVT25_013357 [Psilocybe cyanescens]|uniref:Uncharacterized protein n=1 Tax=Psilocybe cyanescens TaxID=93625 RepID=A0A409WT77_PSICY|nr:hypothetical protein CVT25_013357 [Psilocybe cyanescens]
MASSTMQAVLKAQKSTLRRKLGNELKQVSSSSLEEQCGCDVHLISVNLNAKPMQSRNAFCRSLPFSSVNL